MRSRVFITRTISQFLLVILCLGNFASPTTNAQDRTQRQSRTIGRRGGQARVSTQDSEKKISEDLKVKVNTAPTERVKVVLQLKGQPGAATQEILSRAGIIIKDKDKFEKLEDRTVELPAATVCELAEAYFGLALAHVFAGQWEASLENLEQARELIGDRPVAYLLGKIHTNMAGACWFLKRPQEGIAHLEKAIDYYKHTEHKANAMDGYNNLGETLLLVGEWEPLEQAITLANEIDKRPAAVAAMLDSLGKLQMLRGNLAAAQALLERAVKTASEHGNKWYEGQALRTLSQCHLALNETEQALREAQDALVFGEKIGDRQAICEAKLLLAEAHLQAGNLSGCTEELKSITDDKRGAFTGAVADSAGVIRAAEGGTLFLDEVGDLPLDIQPKLLRFLQEGEIQPLGEQRPIKVDVRVIAATNSDLEEMVAAGRFREDLYYRLNVIRLKVPPLREHRSEIPAIVNYYLKHYAEKLGRRAVLINPQALDLLMVCDWPGNVRQLTNEIQRIVAHSEDGLTIAPDHLSAELRRNAMTLPAQSPFNSTGTISAQFWENLTMTEAVDQFKSHVIVEALRKTAGIFRARPVS